MRSKETPRFWAQDEPRTHLSRDPRFGRGRKRQLVPAHAFAAQRPGAELQRLSCAGVIFVTWNSHRNGDVRETQRRENGNERIDSGVKCWKEAGLHKVGVEIELWQFVDRMEV
ncbi:hypothetical protein P7K49_014009 [Saguinus oedipus]|uniref:Uncharacterized protein n=1 Tax=Saguinus oedipus TaxID=9490 RepID=A0ABQ9VHM9_SAGOE|nr:hypothetical protein P7K49_014009 [Saguinus oedipus]